MADTIVQPGYSVLLPEEVRPHIAVGQRYAVTVGPDGELVLTPVDERPVADLIDDILNRTAGLWRDRDEIRDNSEQTQVTEALLAAGLLTELAPEEKRRAEATTVTLPEVRAALDRAAGKPLSELIIEMRGPKA